RSAGEWFGTRERAEGGHAVHVALRVADEERAAVLARHPGIHREGVERIHERRDLLAETHVEANQPRQQHIAEHAERAESKMLVANGSPFCHLRRADGITAARSVSASTHGGSPAERTIRSSSPRWRRSTPQQRSAARRS